MRSTSRFLAAIGLGAVFAASLAAQTPFQLVAKDQNQNSTLIANGATLTFAANAVGGKVTVTLGMTYPGANLANLGTPSLLGSSEFSLASPTSTTLFPGGSTSVQMTFTANTSAQAVAQLSIPYTETGPASNGSGTITLSSGTIALGLVGTAPQFSTSYYFPSLQNVIPIADGGTLTFPPVLVPAVSQAVFQIQNTGSGAGLIQAIQVTGAAFQATSVPFLPASVNASGVLQFGIVYTPTQAGTDRGTVVITFSDRTVTVNLVGTATAPTLVYQILLSGQTSTIVPNQTIALSSTPGAALPFTIVLQNTGNGNANITGTSLSGVGFQPIDVPSLPQLVAPGGSLSFNYSFVPGQVGSFPGRIRIGNDTFLLSGSGSGPQLTYSFTIASAPTTIAVGGVVPFSPVQIGQSASGTFTIQNSGTVQTTVIGIFIGDAKSPFTLSALTDLPVTLAPNAKTSFAITFAPNTTGINSAVLHVDSATFNVTGSGNAPPPLSDFSFQGSSGVIAPLQQPSVGLTLKSAYSIPLTGTLTITQNPQGFSADPSVQFSSGGATVAFTIPANSTQAIFPNNTTSIRLQTGSVANTITLTPSFATAAGFVLTPSSVSTLQFTVLSAAPQLSNVSVTQTAANGFTLQVAGVVTSRNLSSLDFTFTAQSQFNVANAKVSVDLSAIATNWFQSNNSTSFGGQFVIAVPFALTSDKTGATTTLPAIQAVSVTATNGQGTSNAVVTKFQ